MLPALTLTGAEVLWPNGFGPGDVHLCAGQITPDSHGPQIDMTGARILPGLVDLHGDGFEHHMAPRRGALRTGDAGVIATEAELAANGITTATLAQFFSWEGGMRGPDFAEAVFDAVTRLRPALGTDLRLQLRLETHLLDAYDRALAAVDRYGIDCVVFNDHLQHDRLAEGRQPRRLTGQALKSGRSPKDHLNMMIALHLRGAEVPAAVDAMADALTQRGILMGSHDDQSEAHRTAWAARGAHLCEFPETQIAAQTAKAGGGCVVLGAPNVVRGASHAGNVSARDLVAEGLCDALASDYHYPALRTAAQVLGETGILTPEAAWALISTNPARILGLTDRGALTPGHRADMVIMDRASDRIVATLAGGQVTYL
ncbi:MAG: alpha-D-ribose 1-methylphosphonate 5-triphosphate diphosphatase, partial [Paracoccaceae bacterium]